MGGGVVKEGDVEKLKFQKGREQSREGLGRARWTGSQAHRPSPKHSSRRVPSAEKRHDGERAGADSPVRVSRHGG